MIAADAELPVSVGPYRILQMLGKGGMGAVYVATDERLDRYVALKTLDGLSSERCHLVLVEAIMLAKLNHPSIVQIYDVIEHEGRSIIVMEYVEGEDLQKIVRRHPMSVVSAVTAAISVASALSEAHRQGIVHSDLKLANVLFTPAGVAKLTDFGIAQLLDGNSISQPAKGSVTALSPEGLSGLEVDGRSDLFALGVIIYQMLSGRTPFSGVEHPRVYFKNLLYNSHLSLSILAPQAPLELATLVDQLLEKSPSMRPASADLVKKRLESIAANMAEREQDTLNFYPSESVDIVEDLPDSLCDPSRLKSKKRGFFAGKTIVALMLVTLGAFSAHHFLQIPDTDPVVVAVLAPAIVNPAAVPSGELLRTSFQQAVVDALVAVSHIHIVTIDDGENFHGDPMAIGVQLQVDEVLASYLDCVDVYCHASLRRYSQSGLKELADLRIPMNSYRTINSLVGGAARQLYASY